MGEKNRRANNEGKKDYRPAAAIGGHVAVDLCGSSLCAKVYGVHSTNASGDLGARSRIL